jgi:hypothetical protein
MLSRVKVCEELKNRKNDVVVVARNKTLPVAGMKMLTRSLEPFEVPMFRKLPENVPVTVKVIRYQEPATVVSVCRRSEVPDITAPPADHDGFGVPASVHPLRLVSNVPFVTISDPITKP